MSLIELEVNRFCDEIQLIVCNIYKKNVAKTLKHDTSL